MTEIVKVVGIWATTRTIKYCPDADYQAVVCNKNTPVLRKWSRRIQQVHEMLSTRSRAQMPTTIY